MIDCGTDSASDVILDPDLEPGIFTPNDFISGAIEADTFLNQRANVDLLFLTHPDEDHHNKLQTILSPLNVKIGLVYFGGDDSISSYVDTRAYLDVVAGKTAGVVRKVDLRENPAVNDGKVVAAINDTAVTATAGVAGELGKEFVDARGALVVYFESDAKSDFTISLIAGNVTGVWKDGQFVTAETDLKAASEKRIDSNPRNRRCLVALIECFGQRILVCGDATIVTERFELNHFTAPLGTIQYLRMGHHGSTTSSTGAYLGAFAGLKTAIASTGGQTTVVHNLPKQVVLSGYVAKTAGGAAAHSIYSFEQGDTVSRKYITGTEQMLFATGSNDSYPIVLSKS
jgi:hypothetical protein